MMEMTLATVPGDRNGRGGETIDEHVLVTPSAVDCCRVRSELAFASDVDAARRRDEALGLGALAYCYAFETPLRKIEEVFASVQEER